MIFSRTKNLDKAATETSDKPVVPAAPAPAAAPAQTAVPAPAAPVQAASPAPAAPTAPAPANKEMPASDETDKEQLARRAMGAKMMVASFGEIVTVLMRSETYRHFSLSDLDWLVIPPVLTQQFVLAEARKGEDTVPTPIGVALWATVSPEVDQKLSSNTTGPLRLRPDEWKSGDILWLIDAVGPPQVINGLIENLHKSVFKGRPLKVRGRDEEGKPVIKIQQLPAEGTPPAAS